MSSRKAITFVVISFLAIALILNSSYRFDVFAKPKLTRGPISCAPLINDDRLVRCCQTQTDSAGLELTYCTFCDNTNPPSNCSPRTKPLREQPPEQPPKSLPPVVTTEPPSVAPPPKGSSPKAPGAIEQPPSTVKDNTTSPSSTSQRTFSPTGGCIPGGTTCIPCDIGLARIGANCIPSGDWHPSFSTGGGSEGSTTTPPSVQPPAQGGAIEQSPSNVAPPPSPSSSDNPVSNNNLPTPDHNKPKGSDLGQLVGGGGESASKKGNNNDNSPTPPACPDKGPIPPNCTLKPKF